MNKVSNKIKPHVMPVSRVIIDSRDASKDHWIPASDARELYRLGKLEQDITNSKVGEIVYCIPVKGENVDSYEAELP